MLCLNLLNKTVKLLFILCNFAIVPFKGTGIKIRVVILIDQGNYDRTLQGYGD